MTKIGLEEHMLNLINSHYVFMSLKPSKMNYLYLLTDLDFFKTNIPQDTELMTGLGHWQENSIWL